MRGDSFGGASGAGPRSGSKRLLFLGAIGNLMTACTAPAFGVLFFFSGFYYSLYSSHDRLLLMFVVGVLFLLGFALQAIGFLAIARGWGSRTGRSSFAIGILAVAIFLPALYFVLFGVESSCWSSTRQCSPPDWASDLYMAAHVLLGISYVAGGATYIGSGGNLGNRPALIVAGAFTIVGGCIVSTYFEMWIGLLMIAPSSLIAGIVLAMAPHP